MSSQLCLLVLIYNAHDVETYILPMAFHLANDRVAQIRHVTLRLVIFVLTLVQNMPEWLRVLVID